MTITSTHPKTREGKTYTLKTVEGYSLLLSFAGGTRARYHVRDDETGETCPADSVVDVMMRMVEMSPSVVGPLMAVAAPRKRAVRRYRRDLYPEFPNRSYNMFSEERSVDLARRLNHLDGYLFESVPLQGFSNPAKPQWAILITDADGVPVDYL